MPGRLTFSVLCAGVLLAAWNASLWLAELASNPFANDFLAYYGGARVGMVAGWRWLYDVRLQQQFEYQAGTHGWEPYVNPPPLAWLVAPLTHLPFRPADWVWGLLLLAVLAAAARLAGPRGSWRPAAATAAVLGWFPGGFALLLGQASVLVAGGMVLAVELLERRRDVLAGLALCTIALKPQDAILVPFALLVAGRLRTFVAWALGVAVLAAISLFQLGGSGLTDALHLLAIIETAPLNHRFAVEGVIGDGWPVLGVHAILGAAALLAARRRRRSPAAVVAIGLIGSFLVVPHVSLQDYCVIAIAALFLLRSSAGWRLPAVLAVGFVAGEFAVPLGPTPLLAALVGLLAASFHHEEDGRAGEDDPEVRENAADHPLRPPSRGGFPGVYAGVGLLAGLERRLVTRFGSTAYSGLAAGLWGLPLCFFAGGVEFDARAYWGLWVAIVLFPAWVLLAARARRLEAALVAAEGFRRPRRFDPRQMSAAERGWAAGFGLALLAIIGWLNAAATVDLGGLAPGLATGNSRILGLVEVAVVALIVAIAAAVYCWTRNARAFLRRLDRLNGVAPGS